AGLIDYFPAAGAVVIDEPMRVREQMELYASDFAQEHSRQLEAGRVVPEEMALCLEWDRLLLSLKGRPAAFFSTLQRTVPGLEDVEVTSVTARSPERFHGQMEPFIDSVREWLRGGFKVTLITATRERLERLREVLAQEELPLHV